MKILGLVFLFVMSSVVGGSAAEHFWIGGKTDTGPTAGLVGCEECDDISVWLSCDRETQTIEMRLYTNYASDKPTPKKRAFRAVFQIEGKKPKTARAATFESDEMNGGWLPVIRINRFDPVVRRMIKNDGATMTVTLLGKSASFNLKGAAPHLKKLRARCAPTK